MQDHEKENIAETVARINAMPVLIDPKVDGWTPAEPTIMMAPEGWRPHDLSHYFWDANERLKPARRTGTARFESADSLIAWTNRHKSNDSVIFAKIEGSDHHAITTIIDYHEAGAPETSRVMPDQRANACRHRGHFPFPLSDEWRRWTGASGKALSMAEFGEFIEENAKDVLDPTPALLGAGKPSAPWEERMIETAQRLGGRFGSYAVLQSLANGFKVIESQDVEVKINRDTGETEVQFLTQHKQPDGQPVKVPNLFMVAIPVFQLGALWRLAVRFRYRKVGGDIRFTLAIHEASVIRRKAMLEVVEAVVKATDLPVFIGSPESN